MVTDYSDIGVKTFINCCGTRTIHSGTLMLPCVREAMIEASRAFVNMDELMDGVGSRIAELTEAGHAIVTSGGAASLCVATAAAVTGGDPERIQRLPAIAGARDRVVMLRSGRFTYDQAIRAVGVTIVEVETEAELTEALEDQRTVMVALLGTDTEGLSVGTVAGLARPKGVPVLVDAASEHLGRPNPYLEAGASMVAYSGGKYLRGPQCTGLLIGEERWVRAAWTNAAPHHTFARMMKVGKEEVMGLLAAVEHWASERDDEAEYDRMLEELEAISDAVDEVEGVTTEILARKDAPSSTPRLEIRWPDGWIHGLALRDALLDGNPRIMLDDRGAGEGHVYVLPFSIQEGEGDVVGKCIADVLRGRGAGSRGAGEPVKARNPTVDVGGEWSVEISLHAGTAVHGMKMAQDGMALTGRHRMTRLENPLRGTVCGERVEIVSEHPYEGTRLVYAFRGELDGDVMRGQVEIGTEGQSAPGPLNRKEYGRYAWKAVRARGGQESKVKGQDGDSI